MAPERWEQVKQIYDSVLKLEASERAAYLDQVCAGDVALRSEVESLLAYETRADNFIEAPALEVAAGLLTAPTDHSAVGRRLGHYQILSWLGKGGMGEVYLAEDGRLGRKVALKLLPARFTQDSERVSRFEREARAASALNHPNIITIHEIGQSDGLHYLVTEYIAGQTLRQRLTDGRMQLSEALEIAVQTASALAAAHEAGIVHRDIKPENIMLRRDGLVKVLDFGLAKLLEKDEGGRMKDEKATEPPLHPSSFRLHPLTGPGTVMGTVGYMSPEQARGQKVDARTDLFSLGVVLYETVSGKTPFAGASSADVIVAILQADPLPLAQYSPAVPEALEWMVTKLLRKDREERYQTAKEVHTDLKSLKRQLEFEVELKRSQDRASGGGAAKGSREVSADRAQALPVQAAAWQSRWGVKAALALGSVAVLTTLWLLLPRFGSDTKEASTSLNNVTTQLTDQPGPEYFPSLSPDGKSLIYASRAAGNWDIYLQRVGGRNPNNLTKTSGDDDTQPVFSPDGERIAFRSEREGGGIYLMGATGESVIRLSDAGYNPIWSPDGEMIAFATERIIQPATRPTRSQLWTVNLKSGEKRSLAAEDALQPNWSPHGYRIAYWSRPKESGQGEAIWTIPADPAEGGQAIQVTRDSQMNWNPIWSPDGKYLYFLSNRGGSMNLWRVPIDEKSGATLGPPEAVTIPATSVQHLSFSRDGRRLAYVAQEELRNLKKVPFDPAAGKVVGTPVPITRGSLQLWFPDPSPDGEWLTCYSMGKQRHIFIIRTDGSELRNLTEDAYRYFWPRWSPDGKRIAFSSRRTGSYELWMINRDGSGLRQLTQGHKDRGPHYAPWSPDGSKIAYSMHTPKNDCVIFEPGKAWGEQSLEYLTPLSDPNISFEAWSWSLDGKKLAGIKHLPDGNHAGIGVYDLASQQYDWLTDFGDWPLWLNDSRRLLFVAQGKLLLLDIKSRKHQPVLSVTDEDVDIGSPGLARDNRMIYFTFLATEADVWLLTLE
jgi:eukaryotic-like serine/threonine-protein kinase